MARTKSDTPARRALLEAADELFYRDGIRGVGVDGVAARSGVALMTLYNHFGSKDELVVAYLRERNERFRAWLRDELAALEGTPRERVLAVFDAFAGWVGSSRFRGCASVNARVELADADHPASAVVAEHKREVRSILADHVAAAGFDEPATLAARLALVIEGMQVVAAVEDGGQAVSRAREVADALLSVRPVGHTDG